MVLGGDLEERRKGLGVGVDAAADLVGDLEVEMSMWPRDHVCLKV